MDDEKSPKWRETSFKPGNVAGAGGPGKRSREIGALARRYTVDAVKALVEVVRLPASQHAASKVAAARELLALAYPGASRPGAGSGGDTAVLHLLALQALAPAGTVIMPLTGAPEDEDEDDPPTIDQEGWISARLPPPDADLPDEALPLWENWKARQRTALAGDDGERKPDNQQQEGSDERDDHH